MKQEPRKGAKPQNRLLAAIPAADFVRIQPGLTTIALKRRQVLHRQGEPIRYVYFPNDGIVSMATVLSDGASVEAATVGSEGMLGVGAFFLEHTDSPCETIVQVPVPEHTAVRMRTKDFQLALADCAAFRDVVAHYMQALSTRILRVTACNIRHNVHQRCARWLLAADDHMQGRPFHLSQEFLAGMLGVRRQAVNGVVGTFNRAGFIRYVRGNIRILNRRALEAESCECYVAIARTYK